MNGLDFPERMTDFVLLPSASTHEHLLFQVRRPRLFPRWGLRQLSQLMYLSCSRPVAVPKGRAATPSSAQQHAAYTASLSGRWPAAPARALRVEWVAYLTGVSPQTNGESRTGGKTSRQLLAMWSLSAEYEHAHIHIHNQTRGLHVLHAATLRG